jgi:hypothetical protein
LAFPLTNQIFPPFVPFLLRFPSKIFAVLSMPSINSGFLRSNEIWWEASNKSKHVFAQLMADKWSRWSALNCSTLKSALWKMNLYVMKNSRQNYRWAQCRLWHWLCRKGWSRSKNSARDESSDFGWRKSIKMANMHWPGLVGIGAK